MASADVYTHVQHKNETETPDKWFDKSWEMLVQELNICKVEKKKNQVP